MQPKSKNFTKDMRGVFKGTRISAQQYLQKKGHWTEEEAEDYIARILTPCPDAYVPEIDKETGLPILQRSEYGDWNY